jgi:hypothetical protein
MQKCLPPREILPHFADQAAGYPILGPRVGYSCLKVLKSPWSRTRSVSKIGCLGDCRAAYGGENSLGGRHFCITPPYRFFKHSGQLSREILSPDFHPRILAVAFVFERDFGLYCARFENGPKICKSSAEETINEVMTQNSIAISFSRLQSIVVGSARSINISPPFAAPNLAVAFDYSCLQRTAIVSTLRINISPFPQKPLNDLVVAFTYSRLYCAAIVSALRVNVGSLLE